MIAGIVTARREAVLRLRLYDLNDRPHETPVVVDTGYNGWLALPPDTIAAFGLKWRTFAKAVLADGSTIRSNVYGATVEWDGHKVTLPVEELDSDPLVGMSLMYGYELTLPVLEGATFCLRRLGKA